MTGISLSLSNKTALITGGSRGIGAAAVRMFTAAGARVAFNYQKSRSEADKLATQCGADKAFALQADLSSAEAGEALVRSAVERLGRLDILVANHGIWPPEDLGIEAMPADRWRHTTAVNLESVYGLVKAAVGQMKAQGDGGKIVIVSSTAGQRGEAFHSDYAATKGAIISMVKGLSTELARDRIYVNCVAPGWVDTELVKSALNNSDKQRQVTKAIPLGRVGRPEEIAAPILFLCTDHAGFVTGEVLNVNGGEALVG